ncbi:3-methylaspartate ammonia-lyase glutamate mutase [Stutzerimonas nosocomialis]|uniref:3-methylaspartate ammonia-lyase glutamate mutase n=1 Tax=Stutzerimonas nosocomialis TaxID=1056496 RepID=A0A5R9QCE7_9GAMM|nr:acyclic terpene utilization AtuA family protein [Stutzerimonas nosocomialis]TLX55791.1 3-methylaspartate ammonia-lyase glutamate mutase [Stutzerimonas nosocomialis]TLX58556.1 3-methylaspartate ammonia-lyase glutamate mutase [Stutzerimonas nosocomialis]TLX62355.1 3-methylaspartate ammonia-lyase glutamate mutase [Stutzerimonas nosocomialis]
MKNSIKVLVPTGCIGSGVRLDLFEQALLEKPDVIAMDGGSTDSGPYYLGTGKTKGSAAVLKAELLVYMRARAELGVPLIIGSSGTCGSDAGVDLLRGLCLEVAAELGQKVKIAAIYGEQDAATVTQALADGRVLPLNPVRPIDDALIERCSHIVAAMGVEPFIHALQQGADIIVAGRATDTAVLACLPIMRGAPAGPAWHAGKTMECGAQCTTTPADAMVMAEIDEGGFTITAIGDQARLTPQSVMAHMLYENSNPLLLVEPGGALNVEAATYTALSERSVRVEGSVWEPAERYTVKLEGAAPAGYQSVLLSVVRGPEYIARFDEWLGQLDDVMRKRIEKNLGIGPADYDLQFRAIGKNSALGALEPRVGTPVEIGVLAIATSPDESRTRDILALLNPYMLHFPLPEDEELPTHAFPLSPASMDRGLIYEFALNHVMVVPDPLTPFRFDFTVTGA